MTHGCAGILMGVVAMVALVGLAWLLVGTFY